MHPQNTHVPLCAFTIYWQTSCNFPSMSTSLNFYYPVVLFSPLEYKVTDIWSLIYHICNISQSLIMISVKYISYLLQICQDENPGAFYSVQSWLRKLLKYLLPIYKIKQIRYKDDRNNVWWLMRTTLRLYLQGVPKKFIPTKWDFSLNIQIHIEHISLWFE